MLVNRRLQLQRVYNKPVKALLAVLVVLTPCWRPKNPLTLSGSPMELCSDDSTITGPL